MLNHLLDISITNVHTNDYASFSCVTVYLERTVYQFDAGHFTYWKLNIVFGTDKQLIDIEIAYFILIQTNYKIETSFIFENDTCRFTCIGCTDNGIQFFYIDTVAGNLGTVEMNQQLRQSHSLFYQHIGCSRYLFYIFSSLTGFIV